MKMEDEEHDEYHRRMLYVFIVIIIVLFGSAAFYRFIENWSYIDALYFSAATMTTVGYGDITPKTVAGKIFTIVFVFTGVGIALYGLSLITTHFVEMREKFWLENVGKIRIRHHTETFWEKLKVLFSYRPEEIVNEYEKSKKRFRRP